MPGSPKVLCDLRKYDRKPHYTFEADRLGEDDYGIWLGVRAGTPMTGPHGASRFPHTFTTLVPRDEWYLATWYDPYVQPGEGEFFIDLSLYVDIATPAEWPSETHVITVDLDLDVYRRRDGTIGIDDEDEFAEHQVSYGYPPEVIAAAWASCEKIHRMVTEGAEPFGGASMRWLEMVLTG